MPESIFSTFAISGSGMSVQRKRLDAVASNIANANTTKTESGEPYQRKVVIVRAAASQQPFQRQLQEQIGLRGANNVHIGTADPRSGQKNAEGVQSTIARDNAEPRMVYDPAHPDANGEGYVSMPNINIVTEMVEMISAQRGFEANASVISAAKNIARDSLDI